MRTAYHQQLAGLTAQLAEMCRLARIAMRNATQALSAADLGLASGVLRDQERIAAVGEQVRQDAFVLLALQAPVAGDLRAVIASIQNAGDVERMGSLALHVAQIAARRYPRASLPEDLRRHFAEMGRIAEDLGRGAQHVLMSADPQAAALLPEADVEMNRLHQQVLSSLVDGDHKYGTTATVDATLLSKFYERYADHAVEVARRVVFQATGQLPETEHSTADRIFAAAGAGSAHPRAGAVSSAQAEVAPDDLVAAGARHDRTDIFARAGFARSAALSD
jgi:phosphate transport system protein